ncbi:MAG: hypothetical protein ABEJ78_11220 [Haloferacaceae archaeon]
MSDGNTRDEVSEPAPYERPDDDSPLYAGDEAEEDVSIEVPDEEKGFFARVPEGVVALGAGSLATSALITLVFAGIATYSVVTGRWYGYQPYVIVMASVLYSSSAVFQISGVYYAQKRVRWLWVMLAAFAGVPSIVGIPFAAVAIVCLGLGKYHFASYTPSEYFKRAMSDDDEIDADETGTDDDS